MPADNNCVYLDTDLPDDFKEALDHWRIEADRILNSDRIQWPAKLASTSFTYHGESYTLTSRSVYTKEDLQSCSENILDAGFEILQSTITKDLERLGAEDICNISFLD